MRTLWSAALAASAAVAVAGCGGGGGSAGGSGSPTGWWHGSTSSDRAISALVLPDGTTWALYSAAGNASVISGAVLGPLNGAAVDLNLEGTGARPVGIFASAQTRSSIAGSISDATSVVTFSGAYDPGFEQAPSLAAAAGTFPGRGATTAGGETGTMTLTAGGAITGTSASGCSYTGVATPRADANAFNMSLTFGGGACALGASTVTGQAYYNAGTRVLYAAGLNAARSNGFVFVGQKP